MTVTDFPNATPNFFIGFQGSRKLDPRITFTRASGGGRVGTGSGNVNSGVYTFQENVPRLTDNGLLIEGRGINREIWSTEFSNWLNNGGAMDMTDNAEVAPDGTTTACRFIQSNTTNATRSISSRTNLARNGQRSAQTLWVRRVSGTDPQPTITLTAIGGSGPGKIIVPTNEWQKITNVVTNINDGNTYYCQVLTLDGILTVQPITMFMLSGVLSLKIIQGLQAPTFQPPERK